MLGYSCTEFLEELRPRPEITAEMMVSLLCEHTDLEDALIKNNLSVGEVVGFCKAIEFASTTGAKRVASSRALIAMFTDRTSYPIDDSIIRCTPMAAEMYAHFADPDVVSDLRVRFPRGESVDADALLRPIVQRAMPDFLAMILRTLAAYAHEPLSGRLLTAAVDVSRR